MKKIAGMALVLTLMLSTVFGKEKKQPAELNEKIEQVILLTDLTPDMTKELLEGKHPNIAIECREGTELPVKYIGNYGLFSVKYFPNLTFKIEKTCYLRTIKKKGYLSFDLNKWEKPNMEYLDTSLGISQDKSHIVLETKEEPAYQLH